MNRIEIYSAANCPWCDRAKSLLRARGIEFEEIDITADTARVVEMTERSGKRTVPQIFIDDFHVGGYDDMAAMDARGELDPMLGLGSDPHGYGSDASEDGPT